MSEMSFGDLGSRSLRRGVRNPRSMFSMFPVFLRFASGLSAVLFAVSIGVAAARAAWGPNAIGVDAPPEQEELPAKAAEEKAPRTAASIEHVRVLGDLDTMRMVQEVDDRLRSAQEGEVVILELSGRTWRPDVLLGLIRSIEQCRATTIGYVSVAAGELVQPAFAAAALACDRTWVDPGARFVGRTCDRRDELAPASSAGKRPDAAAALERLGAAAADHLERRRCDALLGDVLLNPRTLVLLGGESGSKVLYTVSERTERGGGDGADFDEQASAEDVGSDRGIRVVERDAASDGWRVELGVADLCALAGDVREAGSVGRILAGEGLAARGPVRRVVVRSTLARDWKNAVAALNAAGSECDRAESLLKPPRAGEAQRENPAQRRRRRADGAAVLCAAAASLVEEALGLASASPEIMRLPPPGETAETCPIERREKQWGTQLRKGRERVEAVRLKVDRFRGD